MIFWSIALLSGVTEAEELHLETDHAMALHLSNQGLDQIGRAIRQIIPDTISISAGQGTLDCSTSTSLNYDLLDWELILALDNIEFNSQNDQLNIMIYGHLDSSESSVHLVGECSVFEDVDETCGLQIPTTPFTLGLSISMVLENGLFISDAQDPVFTITPITNPLNDCLLSDAVDTILGQNSNFMSDVIVDAVMPELDAVPSSIEESLNGLIDDLTFSDTMDLLGTDLLTNIFPTAVYIEDTGIVLGFGSDMTVPVGGDCVDISAYDAPTEVAWPSFDGLIFDSNMHYDAGLFFSRHFIENALYAAWASDSLCIDVGQLSGLSLTGEFTSSFFGEEMNELIGAQSVELTLRPLSPFTVLFSDDQPPFSLIMDDFALEGFGPVLHRRSRLLQVNLDSEIGIWMNLEGNSLYPELPLTQEDFFVQEAYSEILSAGYSEGVPSLIELALSSVLPEDAMPILHLPVVLGLELDTIIWDHDQDQDWLGAFVLFNTDEIEAMPISGCSASDLGCDSGGPQVDIDVDELLGCNDVQVGCEGGCAHQKGLRLPFGRIFGGLMICCMAIVRRRD